VEGLFSGFFQLGYVTRDLTAGIKAYTDRFGAADFMHLPIAPPNDGTRAGVTGIALAYIGEVMVEMIETDPLVPSIFTACVPEGPGALRLHHLGYLVTDFNEALDRVRSGGYEIPFAGTFGDVLDYGFADTRNHLGHYSEFIRLGEPGKRLYASVPRTGKLQAERGF
jgi:hypothetical protein